MKRDTDLYRRLLFDSYRCVALAEGFEESTSEDPSAEILTAWQVLHDSRLAYKLQGWFGREAQALIAQGLIDA